MNPWTYVVGWTLMHFLWQGAAVALAAAAALALCRRRSATVRYMLACVALGAMVASPPITVYRLLATEPWGDRAGLAYGFSWTGLTPPVSPPVASGVEPETREAPSQTIARRVERVLPLAVWLWLGGASLLLARTAVGWWRVRRLQAASRALRASRWQAAADRMSSHLHLATVVHVVESMLVDVPTVVGWLRPVILLPVAAVANLTPGQIEAILAHELAHVRRHDYVVNLLQTLAETLLFYHPGVWWVSARIRAEREHCCDDVAVEVCGDAVSYAAALTELESWRTDAADLSLAATGGRLLARIRRLLRVPVADEAPIPAWVVALTIVAAGATIAAAQSASPGLRDQWRLDSSEHFDIYYLADVEPQLAHVSEQAERSYRQISFDLKHDLGARVPLVVFRTRRDMQRLLQTWSPAAVGATFGIREHLLLPIDGPSHELNGLITHELTHQFEFDILPRSIGEPVPAWVMEGFADYERGTWTPRDVAQLRELAAAPIVPPLSASNADDRTSRRADNLGHAAFDFIEATHGKNGIRQFLLAIRMNRAGRGGDVYEAAFQMRAEAFDAAFERYLAERFPTPPPPPPPPAPGARPR